MYITYNSMVHRLFSIEESEQNFSKKLDIIRQIVTNNGLLSGNNTEHFKKQTEKNGNDQLDVKSSPLLYLFT